METEIILTTDASRTGLGISLRQKQTDNSTRPIAFASRYLNDAKKNYSIGELELWVVVWVILNFRSYLYGKLVHLYTGHQALEPFVVFDIQQKEKEQEKTLKN